MRKVNVFNFITLNGYYKGPNDDTSWHEHGKSEEGEFAAEGAKSKSTLLFGRKTYEMMASFWPTPAGQQLAPEVAKGMNESEKIVFSRTLKKADWKNTTLVKENMVDAVRNLKGKSGSDMVILGSGSIVTQLADAGLIDTFQFMIDPVALGTGTPIFQDMKKKLDLKLVQSRIFKSGTVLLTYEAL
jgi:dihydrofolate reductase